MYVTHQWFARVISITLVVVIVGASIALDAFAATGVDRYTVALYHGDGTDASTTFTDSSFVNTSASAIGNAQVDTAQSKFGGASMLFDGSGDYVRFADSDLWYFANDDFTIDFWFRVTSASAEYTLFDHSQDPTNGPYFNLSKLSSSLHLYWYYAGTHCNKTSSTVSWAANTWYHVALVRYNGTVTMYVDGSSVGTTTGCPNYNDTSTFEIGGSGYVADFSGWIDEFRITKGIARWTSSFTPPTGEYGPDGRVTTFLTSGTSWTVPSDWNSNNNTIEVIAGGGGGGGATSLATRASSGGGGGAYSRAINVSLTPGGTVTYAVGSGGAAGANSSDGGTGGDSYFCNSTSNCASILGSAVVVGAKGGTGAGPHTGGTPGVGGAAASGVGNVRYSGGDGVIGVVDVSSAGGAGAAGPNGDGEDSPTVGTGTAGGRGGRGGAGYGGLGGGDDTSGTTGNEWGFGYGSGGGGGSRNTEATGIAGALYGGGGGGYYSTGNNGAGGAGAAGIVVITYYPSTASTLTINASRFLSNLDVRGNLSKGSGTFMIDHPTKPATHLLFHSFVESPDVKNLYDGIAQLDIKGDATIQLPDYFEALNKDFRYQFFPLDEAMPNLHIKKEIENNRFTIGGGVPYGAVSWQVTGTRHDPYIQEHPIQVEVEKGPDALKDKGECLYEPVCTQ